MARVLLFFFSSESGVRRSSLSLHRAFVLSFFIFFPAFRSFLGYRGPDAAILVIGEPLIVAVMQHAVFPIGSP